MLMVITGDFEPEKLIQEIKNRIVKKENKGEIKRIYPEEPEEINKEKIEAVMDVNNPLFVIAIKDKTLENETEQVKKHIAIEILLNIIVGKSSKLYKELYETGIVMAPLDLDYEFSKQYAHIAISGQSNEPERVMKELKKEIEKLKKEGLEKQQFERIKKKIYGDYVTEYNDISGVARMLMADYFKGINSFEYIENHKQVTKEYAEKILREIFDENKMVISIVKGK